MARKRRPFTPGTKDKLPVCGSGRSQQYEIVAEPKPPKAPKALLLLDMPHKGSSFPELVNLTKRLNKAFDKPALRCLQRKRKSTGEKTLEMTLALDRGRFYVTYAVPIRGKRP
jgi:hypothetical protein